MHVKCFIGSLGWILTESRLNKFIIQILLDWSLKSTNYSWSNSKTAWQESIRKPWPCYSTVVYLERYTEFNVGENWSSQMVSKVLQNHPAKVKQGYLKYDRKVKAGYVWKRFWTITGKFTKELRRYMTITLWPCPEFYNAPTQNHYPPQNIQTSRSLFLVNSFISQPNSIN